MIFPGLNNFVIVRYDSVLGAQLLYVRRTLSVFLHRYSPAKRPPVCLKSPHKEPGNPPQVFEKSPLHTSLG